MRCCISRNQDDEPIERDAKNEGSIPLVFQRLGPVITDYGFSARVFKYKASNPGFNAISNNCANGLVDNSPKSFTRRS
jgi:hypothetical protein